jgi:hypothetical protein
MAQSTDEPDGPRPPPLPKRATEPDPGYEVLSDDDEPHDAEYRRRRWRRAEEDDDEPRRRRGRGKMPRIVNVLGIAAAVACPAALVLSLATVVVFLLALGGGVFGGCFLWFAVLYLGVAAYFADIAWSVFQRRISDNQLRRSFRMSLVGGVLLGLFSAWFLRFSMRWETGQDIGLGGALLSGGLLGFAVLAVVTRRRLREWRDNRWRDW